MARSASEKPLHHGQRAVGYRLLSGSTFFLMIAVGAAVAFQIFAPPRVHLPVHLLGHPVAYFPELLSEQVADELIMLAKSMKDFPSVTSDLSFYKTRHEHIGEAQQVDADGSCKHPFLIPSLDKTVCILPGRVDVGRHYVSTGGYEGLNENYDVLISRVQSFSRYMFNVSQYKLAQDLFASPHFIAAAKSVCPVDKPVLDPFQFNIINQLPGQTVATHLDAPYFWGMDRFDFPQWLLVSMVFSGLFEKEFIPQVQVVAYFHTWNDTTGEKGGQFVYWQDNEPVAKFVPPAPRSGSTVDGSKTVHAATVFQPNIKPPMLDRAKKHVLQFVTGESWHLVSDGHVVNQYTTNDIRFSIVYRARCFESEAERTRYHNIPADARPSLSHVMDVFKSDLMERGVINSLELDALTLATTIMDTYINYPLPPLALIPMNYCALPKLVPVTSSLFQLLNICQ
jgi:hypothetical protein